MLTQSQIRSIPRELAQIMLGFEDALMIFYVLGDQEKAEALVTEMSRHIDRESLNTIVRTIEQTKRNDDKIYSRMNLKPTDVSRETIAANAQKLSNTLKQSVYFSYARLDWTQPGFKGYGEELRQSLKVFAAQGITTVTSGARNYSIEAYTRMSVTGGAIQASAQASMERARSVGVDKVIISKHMGARPDHAAWQGKVFTMEELHTVCGYGTITGIC